MGEAATPLELGDKGDCTYRPEARAASRELELRGGSDHGDTLPKATEREKYILVFTFPALSNLLTMPPFGKKYLTVI